MAQDWSTFTTTIANLCGDPLLTADPNFVQFLPQASVNAETRICRELDFLGSVVTNSSVTCTPGTRQIDWTNAFFAVESMNVITPAGTTNPELGTRSQITFGTKELCDALYPSATASGVPKYLGRVTQSGGVFGPFPDQAYTLEITGTQRPTPLSATNTTTFISTYLWDLFIAGTMIEMAAFQANFNAAGGDNPQQATNWKTHYTDLLGSAIIEEARKKFTAEGWSAAQPAPNATPPRT